MITPDASKYLPQMGLSPKRRNCESSGCPLLLFRVGLLSKPQRLNPSDNMENYYEEVHTLRCSCNSATEAVADNQHSDHQFWIKPPVFAQAAIQEPGLFAFYYPNNDVLNGGRPTPAARMDAMAGLGPFSGSYVMPRRTVLRTVLLVPSGTVPMNRLQGRSLDTAVAGASAGEPARRL